MSWTREITVDLWRTSTHSVNIGINKQEQLMSKSRQFTKDTEIIGEISEKGETTGYVTYRKDQWDSSEEKRLVIKIFSDSIGWKSSMEELHARELSQSFSINEALPMFSTNINRLDYLLLIEKVHLGVSFNQEKYVCFLIDDKTGEGMPIQLVSERISIGGDWYVLDHHGNKIAEIDGKSFNIGGKYVIRMIDNLGVFERELVEILVLFATYLKFKDEVEKDIMEKIKQLRQSEGNIKVDPDELALYRNPRRIKV